MDITLSDSCLNMKQNPILSLLNGEDKNEGLFDDSQDGRSKMFESTFSLIANDLLDLNP
ncbi:hypothetical protein [Endozoicomonas sp. Mp262]|uniref:hypothetical protein n=1 Tax=Endozoicomonas sp. Mp262 TaxID=2919499 RepID=UPI0021D8A84C